MDFTNIKNKRKEKGMTQDELSEKSGIGRVTISRLESGTLTETNVGTLTRIASALDCEMNELMSNFDAG